MHPVSEPPRANPPPRTNPPPPAAPVPSPRARNRAGAILLLVAVPLLVLFALWRFKHRLIEVSPNPVTTEAIPQTAAPVSPALEPGKGSAPAVPAREVDAGVDASSAPK